MEEEAQVECRVDSHINLNKKFVRNLKKRPLCKVFEDIDVQIIYQQDAMAKIMMFFFVYFRMLSVFFISD